MNRFHSFFSFIFRDIDEGGMREAIKDIHDFFLLDVVKKVR